MPFRLEPRGQHSRLWAWASPLVAIVATLIVSTVIFAALGKPAGAALYTFVISPVSSLNGWAELSVKAAPLVLIGVGLAIGFRASVWFGLFGPAGLPPEIVTKLNGTIQRIITDPDFHKRFLAPNFFEPMTGDAAAFAVKIKADAARWSKIIKDAKLTIKG